MDGADDGSRPGRHLGRRHDGWQLVLDKSTADPKQQGNSVNGRLVRKGTFYFNDSACGTFGSVPIVMRSGRGTRHVRVLATGLKLDDLQVDERRGVAYMTTGLENTLIKRDLATGSVDALAHGHPGLASARWKDEDGPRRTLYVSTTGGCPQWLDGNATAASAIHRVEV